MKDLSLRNPIWRLIIMYKQTMGFVRGIGAGVVAGVAISAMGSKMMKQNRHLRRNANRAMHAVNGMMDNVTSMFR